MYIPNLILRFFGPIFSQRFLTYEKQPPNQIKDNTTNYSCCSPTNLLCDDILYMIEIKEKTKTTEIKKPENSRVFSHR